MNILKVINSAFERQRERGWHYIYIFIDIHGTIFPSSYDKPEEYEFYPYAKETLQYLTKREDIKIGLYTCSYPHEIAKYLAFFDRNDIKFDFINKNTDEQNTSYGYFNDKTYFNVLLEDKAGFEPEKDWRIIYDYFHPMSSTANIEELKREAEPYINTLVISMFGYNICKLVDVIEVPDDDIFWILIDDQERKHHQSCLISYYPLKGIIKDENYDELVRVWNLNHKEQVI